jgi:hypothetical protein
VAEPDRFDVAARVAAINAECEATKTKIEADYQAHVEGLRDLVASPQGYDVFTRVRGRPLSPREARAKCDQLLREAEERRHNQLETVALEQRLLEGTPPRSDSHLSRRDPIPVSALTEAVRLVHEGATLKTIKEQTGLTVRKGRYVRAAVEYGDLVWDEAHGCISGIRNEWNTPQGVRLPVRPDPASQARSG